MHQSDELLFDLVANAHAVGRRTQRALQFVDQRTDHSCLGAYGAAVPTFVDARKQASYREGKKILDASRRLGGLAEVPAIATFPLKPVHVHIVSLSGSHCHRTSFQALARSAISAQKSKRR